MSEADDILRDLHVLPDADPRDMSQQQASLVREAFDRDLFAFAWAIFGFHDLYWPLHGEICEFIHQWGRADDWRRLMIQVPRGSFKSSLCTMANAMWQVCRDPNQTVVIFNERVDNPAKWLRAIRDTVQSSRLFQAVYPELLPPGVGPSDNRSMPRWWKWSDTELLFQRSKPGIPEASITGLGIGAAAAGGHWNKVIKDDLVSHNAAYSPSTMEYVKEWFDKSFYLEKPAILGQDLIACTPWTHDDVYVHALRNYKYRVYRRSALEPDPATGQPASIFPTKLTTEMLLQMQARDPEGFAAQMQCMPTAGRDRSFDQGWIKWGKLEQEGDTDVYVHENWDAATTEIEDVPPRVVPLHLIRKCLLVDPAPSEQSQINKERNARNAIVVVGCDPWGRRYLLDCWAGRVDPGEVVDKIFEMARRWGTKLVGIEEVVFSLVYRHWIARIGRDGGDYLQVVPLKPDRQDKDTRIISMIPEMKGGFWHFTRGYCAAVVQELVQYPHAATRDLIDAMAYHKRILHRPETTGQRLEREWRLKQRPGFHGDTRDPITAY